MQARKSAFFELTVKTIVVHTVTYFIIGLIAFTVFNYAVSYAEPGMAAFMRQTDDPIVALGPALQPFRGILFALAFFPLQETLFERKNGWLVTWSLLVILGIFSTFAPAPGSVEGLIYTTLPLRSQLSGGLLYYWVNHPEVRWLNWMLGFLMA
jgi:drug/metabolite transporter (DMT)-like permease